MIEVNLFLHMAPCRARLQPPTNGHLHTSSPAAILCFPSACCQAKPSTMEDEVTPVCAAANNEAPPQAVADEGTPLLPAPATTGVGKKKKAGSGGTSDARAFKDDE